jgi:hypothetical protein
VERVDLLKPQTIYRFGRTPVGPQRNKIDVGYISPKISACYFPFMQRHVAYAEQASFIASSNMTM